MLKESVYKELDPTHMDFPGKREEKILQGILQQKFHTAHFLYIYFFRLMLNFPKLQKTFSKMSLVVSSFSERRSCQSWLSTSVNIIFSYFLTYLFSTHFLQFLRIKKGPRVEKAFLMEYITCGEIIDPPPQSKSLERLVV